jgi:hypothetical protein
MRIRPALALAPVVCLLATAPGVLAQSKPPIMPKLGKWEMTQDVAPDQAASMAGMPPQVLQRIGYDPLKKTITSTLCLSTQSMKEWEDTGRKLREAGNATCDDPTYSASGDSMTMALTCTAPRPLSMRNAYHFNAARDAYTYESEMTTTVSGKPETRRTRGTARRIGDC